MFLLKSKIDSDNKTDATFMKWQVTVGSSKHDKKPHLHIEADTRWLPFSWWHIQMDFLELNYMNFD